MISVDLIKAAAEMVTDVNPIHAYGVFRLTPPVALRDKGTGEIVHAKLIDEDGFYPRTVQLVERIKWWSIDGFEFPPVITDSANEETQRTA